MSRSLKWAAAGIVTAGLAAVVLWPPAAPPRALPESPLPDPAEPAVAVVPETPSRVSRQAPVMVAAPPSASAPAPRALVLGESELMVQLRELTESDPAKAIELARDAQARLPNSPDAPERGWVIAKSLTNLQRFREAREEARAIVERYPGTPWAADLERHLLTHPLDLPSREQQQRLDPERQVDGG